MFLTTRPGCYLPPEHCCRPWMYPDGWGLFQQGKAPCHKSKMVYGAQRRPLCVDLAFKFHRSQSGGACVGCADLWWLPLTAKVGCAYDDNWAGFCPGLLPSRPRMANAPWSYVLWEYPVAEILNSKLFQYLSPEVGMIPTTGVIWMTVFIESQDPACPVGPFWAGFSKREKNGVLCYCAGPQ